MNQLDPSEDNLKPSLEASALRYFSFFAGYPGDNWCSGAFARLEEAVAAARNSPDAAETGGARDVAQVTIEHIQRGREAQIRYWYLWNWTDESPWRAPYEQWFLGASNGIASFNELADVDPDKLLQTAQQIVGRLQATAAYNPMHADLLVVTVEPPFTPTPATDALLSLLALELCEALPGQILLKTPGGQVSRSDYWRQSQSRREAAFATAREQAKQDLPLTEIDLAGFDAAEQT